MRPREPQSKKIVLIRRALEQPFLFLNPSRANAVDGIQVGGEAELGRSA